MMSGYRRNAKKPRRTKESTLELEMTALEVEAHMEVAVAPTQAVVAMGAAPMEEVLTAATPTVEVPTVVEVPMVVAQRRRIKPTCLDLTKILHPAKKKPTRPLPLPPTTDRVHHQVAQVHLLPNPNPVLSMIL